MEEICFMGIYSAIATMMVVTVNVNVIETVMVIVKIQIE